MHAGSQILLGEHANRRFTHSDISSRIGISVFPSSVIEYSTQGGTSSVILFFSFNN